jgi:hypothetical protein
MGNTFTQIKPLSKPCNSPHHLLGRLYLPEDNEFVMAICFYCSNNQVKFKNRMLEKELGLPANSLLFKGLRHGMQNLAPTPIKLMDAMHTALHKIVVEIEQGIKPFLLSFSKFYELILAFELPDGGALALHHVCIPSLALRLVTCKPELCNELEQFIKYFDYDQLMIASQLIKSNNLNKLEKIVSNLIHEQIKNNIEKDINELSVSALEKYNSCWQKNPLLFRRL